MIDKEEEITHGKNLLKYQHVVIGEIQNVLIIMQLHGQRSLSSYEFDVSPPHTLLIPFLFFLTLKN